MNIHWRLFTEANSLAKADKIVNRFIEQLACGYQEFNTASYHKGGFVSTFITPLAATDWPNAVVESLQTAQRVGGGWILSDDIECVVDGWSNEPTIKGVNNIHFLLEKNR